jgi:hypothetical protein
LECGGSTPLLSPAACQATTLVVQAGALPTSDLGAESSKMLQQMAAEITDE